MDWWPVLEPLGVSRLLADGLVRRAAANRTDILAELVATGLFPEADIYRSLADDLGLVYVDELDHDQFVLSEEKSITLLAHPERGQTVKLREETAATIVDAPRRLEISLMQEYLNWLPALRDSIRITAPAVLRRALMEHGSRHLLRHARLGLFDAEPSMSARSVASAWQGAFFSFLALLLPGALVIAPLSTLFVIHAIASVFFFACVALRIAASPSAVRPQVPQVQRVPAGEVPIYSVLVALYREADVVPELLASLSRLQWPRSKLEIKLVCEADDLETLAAIDAHSLRPYVEVIRVPPIWPRTKPKALNYSTLR